jgi:hypothetical protein
MSPDQILDALLYPIEHTPRDVAREAGLPIAAISGDLTPQLYMRNPPAKITRRVARLLDGQPFQVWARYPHVGEVALVITSAKASGVWAEGRSHRANVYTATQAFDASGSDYRLDQYENDNAFAYVLGTPHVVHAVKCAGLDWITPNDLPRRV